MKERDDAFEAAASSIAFMLLNEAFDRVVRSYRMKDAAAVRELLRDLQGETVDTVKLFAAQRPAHARTDILDEAARRVAAAIRAIQDDEGGGDDERTGDD